MNVVVGESELSKKREANRGRMGELCFGGGVEARRAPPAHRSVKPRARSEAANLIRCGTDVVRVLRLGIVQFDEKEPCSLSQAIEIEEKGHADDRLSVVPVVVP